MSLTVFFLQFTGSYFAVMASLTFGILVLKLPIGSELNMPILAALSFWFMLQFSKKNRQIPTGKQLWKLIGVALLGTLLANALMISPFLAATSNPLMQLAYGLAVTAPLLFIAIGAGALLMFWHIKRKTPAWLESEK
ncbi:ABZJ_00895 family protein [Pokkaliibacter sp. CJK22405]|uniref:ABZJ_00895 family protein n=1 Tax=Pokkaliibacter sp. CJK22405 TaxID=3384615 RepID=UPI0039854C8F